MIRSEEILGFRKPSLPINAYRTSGFWPKKTCPITRLRRSWTPTWHGWN